MIVIALHPPWGVTHDATSRAPCSYALLSCPEPHEWTDQLRASFIAGFRSFMPILAVMQNMQSCCRQTEGHVEYEMEWEDAFTLQLKLMDVYSLFVDWCKSDKDVLEMSIVILADNLAKYRVREAHPITYENITVAGHTTYCPRWDFTVHKASVHQAMTRMYVALLLYLAKDPDVQLDSLLLKSEAESFENEGLTFEASFEPCLRTIVFVSQINAGMWKRNGIALQNMTHYYYNVKCRAFMYDKDVLFMQIAASLFSSDDMMLKLIYAFGLTNWIRREYDTETTQDETMRQIISMAESFLNWLIIIICERYNVLLSDVSQSDVRMYEIIHALCMQSMAHSELLSTINDGVIFFNDFLMKFEKEDGFEDLVKEVATFKKPTGLSGKGLYELKDEYYDRYNPYYYHYYKTNKARADENVKKFRKLKSIETDSVNPPPDCLPEFTGIFRDITNLLQCDVFVYVVKLVLLRSTSKYSKSWSESQQERALYLIELALLEETRRRKRGDTSFKFVTKALNLDAGAQASTSTTTPLPSLLVILEKFLLAWTSHHVMRDQANRIRIKLVEMSTVKDSSADMETDNPADDSTNSLQRIDAASRLSSDEKQLKIKSANEASKKSEKAQKRREKMLAHMAKMQRNFIKENQDLFESTSSEMVASNADVDMVAQESLPSQPDDTLTNHPVALGINRVPTVTTVSKHTCILCQEDQDVLPSEKALVYCCYIQNFFEGLAQRDARRNRIRSHNAYDITKKEFVCPMCENLSNAVLPIIPSLCMLSRESDENKVDVTLDEWLDGILKTVDHSIKQEQDKASKDDSFFYVPCPLSTVTKMMAEGVATRFQYLFDFIVDDNSSALSDSIVEMIKKFNDDMFEMSLDIYSYNSDYRMPLSVWNTCAYSILCIENSLRDEEKPLFGSLASKQAECLCTLVRLAAITTNLFAVSTIKRHCIRILSVMSCRYLDLNTPSITDMELFHCLVTLCYSLPSLYKEDSGGSTFVLSNGVNESNALKLVLACHILQIMIADLPARTQQDETARKQMEVDSESENDELMKICQHLRSMVGLPLCSLTPAELLQHIQLSCLPFLRCATLFFHHLTGVPAPLKLFEKNDEEFKVICEYLDLGPNLATLFNQSKHLQDVLMEWCNELSRMLDSHSSATENQTSIAAAPTASAAVAPAASSSRTQTSVHNPSLPSSSTPSYSSSSFSSSSSASTSYTVTQLSIPSTSHRPFTKIVYPRKVNRLIELPTNYSDLINQFSVFSCPKSNSNEDSRNPSMCLVCGLVVCSQSYCCQVKLDSSREDPVGAAVAHAYRCGAGTGIFLRIRDCQVMLMNGSNKGCFVSPPYLDAYGETDEFLRRGNPLALCAERYRYIEKLWINHQIASEISHKVEAYPHHGFNEWHTL
ncbi:hypothetical protein HELRODRAFT_188532 [Helobdella robusta]|uniref:E3 ubiquitin-protein ligase n=1 Tax=Helobdella robusta TaxID=6412 RepID=T1FQ36_HELRO|nr:hypothetical protein HELRODRAFT_188532 [Helobdella robusta]ESO01957.1 hypothetical protein HELRODRAFT_188532 [Helobdella robusta]